MSTILSVDDDAVNQAVIEILLQSHGYIVEQAMDGLEALDWLEKNPLPDLVLLDVMMPNLSGYEVCERIRNEYSMQLPVIMISAKVSTDDIIAGLACLSNDYVTKPFEKDELLARIDSHVKLNHMMSKQRAPVDSDQIRKQVNTLYREVLEIENANELAYLEIRRKSHKS